MTTPPDGSEPAPSLPTDSVVVEPWPTAAEAARPETLELCLVLAWFADEPWRVGHVARLGPGPVAWLGRYHEKFEDEPPVLFFEQRPGLELAAADLMTTKVSRRQLRFSEISRAGARVENVGRRQLFVNGKPAREAHVAPGDTLMLEHTAVFLVDARPPKFAPLAHYPAPGAAPPHESERGGERGQQDKQTEPAFAFGAADSGHGGRKPGGVGSATSCDAPRAAPPHPEPRPGEEVRHNGVRGPQHFIAGSRSSSREMTVNRSRSPPSCSR